ncbi:MAG: aminotransferase class I/II-fold pyridoxal phosphate-dependent enzyme [Ardenticatenaceae bacterium]|nr:aminotransferase class I/II-fold pyridoxal phosphate-dependent enzyme [Ardenticatenaceae bacterium]MCB8949743.1 aminotransferase class I/II-fold pyridoxal phosphate-dependent enzyme [Ardenticatenaceae bacterium]
MAQRVAGFGTTIFTEMTALANEHQAINLGQGFPDFAAPAFMKEAAVAAIKADVNQYAPANGRPRLRQAIAQKVQDFYGIEANPDTEITVLHGATEAIFATILGLVNPGDEVIVFEPFYDSYVPAIQMAGGIPRFYTLRPPTWQIDEAELVALFTNKTKLIIINTPHNPTGKVFAQAELALIASLCQQHDVLAMTDEVYEHLVFDGQQHQTLASFPGMADRTIMISSLGKTFSVTGWKVGWTVAPPELTRAIFRAHQFMTFCGAAPLQEAAVTAVSQPASFYTELTEFYTRKRDFLLDALKSAGLTPIVPSGTYFIMVDISHLGFANDVAFCRYLTSEIGVAAIPPSAFFHNPADGAGLARFAFCKEEKTLAEAANRLQRLK